ncbi:MAG: permease-like cell division protein FtsX [Oscillospiraceae bacterium]
MHFSSFKYLVKEGFRNVWNNRVMSFTSIAVLATCLIIVGAAYLITENVNNMVFYIESQSEMVAFLDDVDDAGLLQIENKIKSIDNIRSYVYVSKEDGLLQAKQMLGESGYLLDGMEDRNTIPALFEIKVKDLELTRDTVEKLQKIQGIYSVQASNEVSDTLTYIQKTVNTFGYALILALAIISLVIITNTIRATIFTRRKEINIMKFVGATNSFIRVPFVVEGFLLGLISATLSFLIIWGSYTYLTDAFTRGTTMFLQAAFDSIIPFKDVALNIGVSFLLCGTLLGMIGSSISIRNHVKV